MASGAQKDLLDTQTNAGDSLPAPVAPLPLMPGQIILDKYEVERVLGVGGMGVVVSAMHLELGERVAIKAMLAEMAASRDHATRFAREAQAAARIKSEFVARVSDVARLPDGTPFMVMEYLEGETLASYLDRHGRLPVETAVDTLLEACVALGEAHRLGIVHRDVKPANLFVARRPDGGDILKVLDFGISKSEENVSITRTSGAIGTPAYMSPEQLRAAGTVRPTADIWSLGVVLFEMLTGALPYEASSFADICALVLVTPPRTPRSIVAELPEQLEAAILKCLRREQAERFQNVPELARALAPFASETGLDLIDRIERIGSARASLASFDDAPISGRRTFSSLPRITPRSLEPRGEGPRSARSSPRASIATPTAAVAIVAADPPAPRRVWIGAAVGGSLLAVAAWVALGAPTRDAEVAGSSERVAARSPLPLVASVPAVAPRPTAEQVPSAGVPSASVATSSPRPPAAPLLASGQARPVSPPSSPRPAKTATPGGFEDFGGRK